MLDVIPLPKGSETADVTTKLIERNSTFSMEKGQTFTLHVDNHPGVLIQAFKGERAMVGDNKSFGKFFLDGIPPAPRGMPQVEVTVDIDPNGILNVSARDKNEVPCGRTNSAKLVVLSRHTHGSHFCR